MTNWPQNEPEDVHGQLKAFLERAERLESEKDAIAEDLKALYGEMKAQGYNQKIMRKIVALRKKDPEKVKQERAEMELYTEQLGLGF